MQKIELRCEICSHKFDANYNIPKVLNCGHTVCSKCVDRMRDKSISKCPFDRKVLDFEDENIAINYYVLSLIDNSIKDLSLHQGAHEEEEKFEFTPKPVINSPGWKNTLDGFIKNDILYTVETNGFIYCTDLNTGEWWFMYHNQFFGNFFFENQLDKKMYLIDQYGSLFQIFNKNYYVQIGKKNAWRNTTHMTVFNNKMFSIESSNKFYETNLLNGKWKEIVINKSKNKENKEYVINHRNTKDMSNANNSNNSSNGSNYFSKSVNAIEHMRYPHLEELSDIEGRLFKNINMLISTNNSILFSNKNGELYGYYDTTGETKLLNRHFFKNIESYNSNSTHVYFFEKNSKIIYRTQISGEAVEDDIQSNSVSSNMSKNSMSSSIIMDNHQKTKEDLEKYEIDIKKKQDVISLSGNPSLFFLNKQKYLKYEAEVFIDLESLKITSITNGTLIVPIKVIVDNKRLIVIDKIGDLYVFSIETRKLINNFQCLFMLRNCHLSNTALIGDGDLLLLDPIRLSLNKLNIIAGTEVIVLHSTKFLYTIKHIFSANSRIYFIDTSGNLYYFNEIDKKLTQIGNNNICKYILDFAVHKNYILTIENSTLYKTNLNDGNYIEIKNEFCKNYENFFADNANIIFITKEDEINVTTLGSNLSPREESISKEQKDLLKLKKTLKFDGISKMPAIAYFRNHIIFYNNFNNKQSIEALNIEDNSHLVLVENFPDINMFINNNDFLSCITRDGVIYKLYC